MKRRNYIILSIIIIVIGIITSISGIIYKVNYNNKYKGYSKVVSAKVVSSVVKSERKKDITGITNTYYVYAPVIEYQVRGEAYRYQSKNYNVKKPKINDKINIVINNNNPKDIKFISKDSTNIIILIGVIITICGLVIVIINLKKPKKEEKNEVINSNEIKEEPINKKEEKEEIENLEELEKEKITETIEVLENEIEEDII